MRVKLFFNMYINELDSNYGILERVMNPLSFSL